MLGWCEVKEGGGERDRGLAGAFEPTGAVPEEESTDWETLYVWRESLSAEVATHEAWDSVQFIIEASLQDSPDCVTGYVSRVCDSSNEELFRRTVRFHSTWVEKMKRINRLKM